jgi:hypothetical protein
MAGPKVEANGNQFRVSLTDGGDTISCLISVALRGPPDTRTPEQKKQAALERAKELAKALDQEITETPDAKGP